MIFEEYNYAMKPKGGIYFMKNIRRIVWGTVLILAAVVIALHSLEIIDFNVFFDGWWTLFIIVPAFVDLIAKKENKLGSVFWLAVGVFLLLCAQGILEYNMLWKLLLPVIIAIIGIKLIVSSFKKDRSERILNETYSNGGTIDSETAVFNGAKANYNGRAFDGTVLTAIFGGVECDLRDAVIDHDCVIKASAIFGGVDIFVPDNVRVISNAVGIFGGVDVEKSDPNGAYTIYIDGVALFGGIDVE